MIGYSTLFINLWFQNNIGSDLLLEYYNKKRAIHNGLSFSILSFY